MSKDHLAHEPYGVRGTIGLINVGPNPTPVPDFYRMIPYGVTVNESKIHEEPRVASEAEELGKRALEAARLLAEGHPKVIAFTCTASAMSVGPEADYEQIEAMERVTQGIPCTTTTTGVFNAFRFMGWKKIAMGGPYVQPVVDRFIEVLSAKGYEVVSSKTLGIVMLEELRTTPSHRAYEIGKAAFVPEADGIFIPCTTFRAIDIIDRLEQETGKPVITSNQASLWECLRLMGIDDVIDGYGELLRRHPRSAFQGCPK
jgi:maleate cis-trans isomerase